MDRMLRKMAKQLNSFDEASLLGLWNDYARRVQTFEPTQEWEEDALIFCLLQAICWKNRLFNYQMASSYMPDNKDLAPMFPVMEKRPGTGKDGPEAETCKRKATILPFKHK